jgi:hypothetical protein
MSGLETLTAAHLLNYLLEGKLFFPRAKNHIFLQPVTRQILVSTASECRWDGVDCLLVATAVADTDTIVTLDLLDN